MAKLTDLAREQFERELAQEAEQRQSGLPAASATVGGGKRQTQGPARMIRENLAFMPVKQQLQVAVDQVFVPEHYRRHAAEYETPEFKSLMESIRQSNGNLDPIDVRFRKLPNGAPGYEVIAGTRRLEACKRLGLTVVFVNERDIDDAMADFLHDVENAKRAEKRPFSLAMELSAMMKSGRYATQAELADKLGRSPTEVSRLLSAYDKAPTGLWAAVENPIDLTFLDVPHLIRAYDKPAFLSWVKAQRKPVAIGMVVKRAKDAAARPAPEKSLVERVREIERGDAYHIVIPKGLPDEIRARVLTLAKELAAKA
jgi:ParB/RepB/Spo0J family partition protein